MENLLEIKNLQTCFDTDKGKIRAVDGVNFSVRPGEMVGVVGESGCGKSVTALSIMRLLPGGYGKIEAGHILWKGEDLSSLTEPAMESIRGNRIGMIFQEPMTSLNPVLKIGYQIEEVFRLHSGLSGSRRRQRTIELLELVGIPDASRRLDDYPHQMSGGMRQRVMIAMSIACNPELLIADEPTTALDVTIQAQILELLKELQKKFGMGVIFITHNLGIVARMSHRVVVMYAGKVVENAATGRLFSSPCHPYTIGLLESIPRLDLKKEHRNQLSTIPGMVPSPANYSPGCRFSPRCPFALEICRESSPLTFEAGDDHLVECWLYRPGSKAPTASEIREAYSMKAGAAVRPSVSEKTEILSVAGLEKAFLSTGKKGEKKVLTAVRGISFSVAKGETLGIVGESGCGKTTAGKMIVGLEEPSAGTILYKGGTVRHADRRKNKDLCRNIQMIFQDPFSSLNPRMTVAEAVSEGPLIHGLPFDRAGIARVLQEVGLQPEYMDRYPHEFSGGQRQRIGIARALAVDPELVICDEPVSALDVSVQAQVINLLQKLQRDRGLTYLFIAHDLSVVRHIADRVMVMYLGQIMEIGPTDSIFDKPLHPYTEALLSAVPDIDLSSSGTKPPILLSGELPSPYAPPRGCLFSTRCFRKIPGFCDTKRPELIGVEENHSCACWMRKQKK